MRKAGSVARHWQRVGESFGKYEKISRGGPLGRKGTRAWAGPGKKPPPRPLLGAHCNEWEFLRPFHRRKIPPARRRGDCHDRCIARVGDYCVPEKNG